MIAGTGWTRHAAIAPQFGNTALLLACCNGRLELVRWLVEDKGADIRSERSNVRPTQSWYSKEYSAPLPISPCCRTPSLLRLRKGRPRVTVPAPHACPRVFARVCMLERGYRPSARMLQRSPGAGTVAGRGQGRQLPDRAQQGAVVGCLPLAYSGQIRTRRQRSKRRPGIQLTVTHTQTHTRTRADTDTYIHTRKHTYTYTYTHTHTHTHIHTQTHTHTHASRHTHTQSHTQSHTHTHTHTVTHTVIHTQSHTHPDTHKHPDTLMHTTVHIGPCRITL